MCRRFRHLKIAHRVSLLISSPFPRGADHQEKGEVPEVVTWRIGRRDGWLVASCCFERKNRKGGLPSTSNKSIIASAAEAVVAESSYKSKS